MRVHDPFVVTIREAVGLSLEGEFRRSTLDPIFPSVSSSILLSFHSYSLRVNCT